jgi:hypothetical protein
LVLGFLGGDLAGYFAIKTDARCAGFVAAVDRQRL